MQLTGDVFDCLLEWLKCKCRIGYYSKQAYIFESLEIAAVRVNEKKLMKDGLPIFKLQKMFLIIPWMFTGVVLPLAFLLYLYTVLLIGRKCLEIYLIGSAAYRCQIIFLAHYIIETPYH